MSCTLQHPATYTCCFQPRVDRRCCSSSSSLIVMAGDALLPMPMASRQSLPRLGNAAVQWACTRRARMLILTITLFALLLALMGLGNHEVCRYSPLHEYKTNSHSRLFLPNTMISLHTTNGGPISRIFPPSYTRPSKHPRIPRCSSKTARLIMSRRTSGRRRPISTCSCRRTRTRMGSVKRRCLRCS